MVLEHDENDRLIAKPYNLNEVNKQKAIDEEQQPKQSLVTTSMLAQQAKGRKSNDSLGNNQNQMNNIYGMANSIHGASNDITPSF